MMARRLLSLSIPVALLLLACFPSSVDAFRRQKLNHTSVSATYTGVPVHEEDIPNVHYLVEMIGRELYAMVDKPKYKFYIYMTIGSLPNQRATIVLISTICNILYCMSILAGFIFFKRGPMLTFTILTLWIGPALVLMLLGTVAMMLAAFAMYPIGSVVAMTLWCFMTSQLAQTLGKKFGLDSDQDGDVDWLDLLHVLARTEIGQSIGLEKLYDVLNDCELDPFREIHRRLDRIHDYTQMNSQRLSGEGGAEEANCGESMKKTKKV